MELTIAQPIKLKCGLTLPNRLTKAAMAERLADKDGLPGGKQCNATYSEWAKGGWGLIISGNVHVDPAHPGAPGDFTVNRSLPREKTLAAWKSWANACSINGTQAVVQINHPGRQAPFVKSLAPSPIPLDLGKGILPWLVRSLVYGTPKEMDQADIDDVVTRFAEAAQLSVEAGFAGVEIHAAHGYLLSQFLSPLSNQRTDAYGGAPLARAKIVIDVIHAVRKAVPAGTCVGIKVNSTDHTDLGDFIIQLKAIVDAGLDFVEVSGGSIEDPMFSTGLHTAVKASTKAREAFFIDFANAIRSELPEVPIMLTGGFRTRQGMEAAVKGGSCDLVGLARPSVLDPALPKKVLDTSIPEHGALAYAKRIEAWSWAKYTGIKAIGMGAETLWYTNQIGHLGSIPS
ncbi:NADH oxidase [Fusarium beomiforme]|uniref:NADH oxidase n=1 Tax=Fusarium beomiforme TaxID=44412 RepID=A0A9P5DWE6_9HYPO|nr:NADH oxidase [Fusarium beomiforme]